MKLLLAECNNHSGKLMFATMFACVGSAYAPTEAAKHRTAMERCMDACARMSLQLPMQQKVAKCGGAESSQSTSSNKLDIFKNETPAERERRENLMALGSAALKLFLPSEEVARQHLGQPQSSSSSSSSYSAPATQPKTRPPTNLEELLYTDKEIKQFREKEEMARWEFRHKHGYNKYG